MERLFEVLKNNSFAMDEATLGNVTAHAWQDAQYSREASVVAKVLADYSEYANYTILQLKERFPDEARVLKS